MTTTKVKSNVLQDEVSRNDKVEALSNKTQLQITTAAGTTTLLPDSLTINGTDAATLLLQDAGQTHGAFLQNQNEHFYLTRRRNSDGATVNVLDIDYALQKTTTPWSIYGVTESAATNDTRLASTAYVQTAVSSFNTYGAMGKNTVVISTSQNWVAPAGVTRVLVEVIGGGSSGSGNGTAQNSGATTTFAGLISGTGGGAWNNPGSGSGGYINIRGGFGTRITYGTSVRASDGGDGTFQWTQELMHFGGGSYFGTGGCTHISTNQVVTITSAINYGTGGAPGGSYDTAYGGYVRNIMYNSGSGGGYSRGWISVTPGASYSVTIGAGGPAHVQGGTGGAGGVCLIHY